MRFTYILDERVLIQLITFRLKFLLSSFLQIFFSLSDLRSQRLQICSFFVYCLIASFYNFLAFFVLLLLYLYHWKFLGLLCCLNIMGNRYCFWLRMKASIHYALVLDMYQVLTLKMLCEITLCYMCFCHGYQDFDTFLELCFLMMSFYAALLSDNLHNFKTRMLS